MKKIKSKKKDKTREKKSRKKKKRGPKGVPPSKPMPPIHAFARFPHRHALATRDSRAKPPILPARVLRNGRIGSKTSGRTRRTCAPIRRTIPPHPGYTAPIPPRHARSRLASPHAHALDLTDQASHRMKLRTTHGWTSLLLILPRRTLKRSRRPRPRARQTPRSRACKTLGMRTPSGPRFVAPSRHSALRLPRLRNRCCTNTTILPRPRWAALSKIGLCPSSTSAAPFTRSRQTATRCTADGLLRDHPACGSVRPRASVTPQLANPTAQRWRACLISAVTWQASFPCQHVARHRRLPCELPQARQPGSHTCHQPTGPRGMGICTFCPDTRYSRTPA